MSSAQWTVEAFLVTSWVIGLACGWIAARARRVRAAEDWRALAESLDAENEQLLDQVAELTDRLDHRARNLRSVR